MKAKRVRRQMRKVLKSNVRVIWVQLCALPRRDRWRLAWLLVRGDARIDKARGRG